MFKRPLGGGGGHPNPFVQEGLSICPNKITLVIQSIDKSLMS